MHRAIVRDRLANGDYSPMVRSGQLSSSAAKAIIESAGLPAPQRHRKTIDLSSNDPKDWLLYAGDYGDHILYDRKLFDIMTKSEQHLDIFGERMIKGMVYAQADDKWCRIKAFGGQDDRIRRMMMTLALHHATTEGVPLAVEPDDLQWVDRKQATVSEATYGPGYLSSSVELSGPPLDVEPVAILERRFRETVDCHDEFRIRLLEMAYAQWTPEPETDEESVNMRRW